MLDYLHWCWGMMRGHCTRDSCHYCLGAVLIRKPEPNKINVQCLNCPLSSQSYIKLQINTNPRNSDDGHHGIGSRNQQMKKEGTIRTWRCVSDVMKQRSMEEKQKSRFKLSNLNSSAVVGGRQMTWLSTKKLHYFFHKFWSV